MIGRKRTLNVSDQQQRGGQAEQQLQGLICRHAQAAALIDGPEGERQMNHQRYTQHSVTQRVAPQGEKQLAPDLHRVKRNHAQRMVEQMGQDKEKQHQAGDQAQAADLC